MGGVSHPADSSVPSVGPGDVPPSVTLLDVREDDEWAAGHAPDAVHLSMSTLTGRLDELPAGPLAVICRSGGRSARVTAYLAGQGRDAVNVDGGMLAWEAEGRPMAGGGPDGPRVA